MRTYKLLGTTVVSFSGGRTSAYMLRQVLDNNEDLSDLVVTFANTGKEHPATLEFVRECAERWKVPIVWLEFRDNDSGFAVVDYANASRQGEPFEALIRKRKYLPNPVTRFCTIDLKIRIIHKYLRSLGLSTEEVPVDMMTGIRADEPRRVVKIRHRKSTSESKWATMVMPLADAGVGVQDVTDFWGGPTFRPDATDDQRQDAGRQLRPLLPERCQAGLFNHRQRPAQARVVGSHGKLSGIRRQVHRRRRTLPQ